MDKLQTTNREKSNGESGVVVVGVVVRNSGGSIGRKSNGMVDNADFVDVNFWQK